MNRLIPTYYTSSTGTTFGSYYYGARYYHSEPLTSWLSVDPLSDKYPNVSPYAYCKGNPINIIDPDGNDGVKVIDKQTRTITVKANYYVTSQPMLGIPNTFYSPSEIESMQNEINNTLNSKNFTFDIDGITYDVRFDLKFIAAGEDRIARDRAKEDYMGNYFSVRPENSSRFLKVKKDPDGTEYHIGGITIDYKEILMNADYDNNRRRIHEIFHTLFFDNDRAKSGIGNYEPGTDMPNQNDINILLKNSKLPKEVVK